MCRVSVGTARDVTSLGSRLAALALRAMINMPNHDECIICGQCKKLYHKQKREWRIVVERVGSNEMDERSFFFLSVDCVSNVRSMKGKGQQGT